jgi:hypothetical protein
VVVEFDGTTTVVLAGGGGLLLLMQPDSRNGANTARLANIFMNFSSLHRSFGTQREFSATLSARYSGASHQFTSVGAYGCASARAPGSVSL